MTEETEQYTGIVLTADEFKALCDSSRPAASELHKLRFNSDEYTVELEAKWSAYGKLRDAVLPMQYRNSDEKRIDGQVMTLEDWQKMPPSDQIRSLQASVEVLEMADELAKKNASFRTDAGGEDCATAGDQEQSKEMSEAVYHADRELLKQLLMGLSRGVGETTGNKESASATA